MKPYNNQVLECLAFKLFRQFARMEYALKAAGYLCEGRTAKANWTLYARSIEEAISNPDQEYTALAIQFIMTHPPRKQIVCEGLIEWDDVQPVHESDADLLLLYVRRVRNNLFHGGKFNGRWFDPERSEKLLRSSLTVLDYCLASSPDVNDAYNS